MKPLLKHREASAFDRTSPDPVAAVDVAGVSCSFGRVKALDGVSLRVPQGTVVGIVGPNVAGSWMYVRSGISPDLGESGSEPEANDEPGN